MSIKSAPRRITEPDLRQLELPAAGLPHSGLCHPGVPQVCLRQRPKSTLPDPSLPHVGLSKPVWPQSDCPVQVYPVRFAPPGLLY